MKKYAIFLAPICVELAGCAYYSSNTYIHKEIYDKYGIYEYTWKKLEGNASYIRWGVNTDYSRDDLWKIAKNRTQEICKTDQIFYDYGEIGPQESQFKSMVNGTMVNIERSHLGIEVRFYCNLTDEQLSNRYKQIQWWKDYYQKHPEEKPMDQLIITNTIQPKNDVQKKSGG